MSDTDTPALIGAVRAGCDAADVHLRCSYPDCVCRHMPAAIRAAIAAFAEEGKKDE
jgi:hypothetical protein